MGSSHSSGAVALLLLLVVSRVPAAESVTCNPYELLPCSNAIFYGGQPTGACCAKLKEQRPCFCQYLTDPNLSGYVNSPNARRVASTCGVPYPKC